MRPGLAWIVGAEFGRDPCVGGCTDASSAAEVRIMAAEPHRRPGKFCNVLRLVRARSIASGVRDRLTDPGTRDAAGHHHGAGKAVRALVQRLPVRAWYLSR